MSNTIKYYGIQWPAGEAIVADIPEGCAVLGAYETWDGHAVSAPIEWISYADKKFSRRGEDPQPFPAKWMNASEIQWRPYSTIGAIS